MKDRCRHDLGLDPLDDGGEHLHGAPTPIQQCAVRDVGAHAGVDLVLTVERKVVVEFRDEDLGQQSRTGHAAGDRTARGRRLDHPLTPAAGLLHPRDLNDLHLRRDQVEKLAGVLAHHPQIAAAIGAAGAGVELAALTRCCVRHARPASRRCRGNRSIGRGGLNVLNRSVALFSGCDQQILQRQLKLGNLALDLFRGLAEGLLLQLDDPQAQGLNQLFVGLERGRHARILRLKRGDHRLQDRGVVRENVGIIRHADKYHAQACKANKTR